MSDQEYKADLLKCWAKAEKTIIFDLEQASLSIKARDLKSAKEWIKEAEQDIVDIRVTTEELTSRFDIIFKN